MNNPLIDLAGVIFGSFGLVLAVAMLVSEHREASMLHRATVGLIGFLCFLVACNSSVSFRSFHSSLSPSPLAVSFAVLISFNWFCRLVGFRWWRRIWRRR